MKPLLPILSVLSALATLAVLSEVAAWSAAQETVTLSTPQTVTATVHRVSYIALDLDNSRISVEIKDNTGKVVTNKVYDATTTPTGATLLSALNTSNNSVTSLVKRVYQRLQTDGVIPAGTIVGAPQ